MRVKLITLTESNGRWIGIIELNDAILKGWSVVCAVAPTQTSIIYTLVLGS
jgi:hypothetical protein